MNDLIDVKGAQAGKTGETIDLELAEAILEESINIPRIALIADVPNWAFHNISKQIVKHLSGKYDFQIFFYGDYPEIENLMFEVKDFDLIHFFWRDALFSFLSDHVRHSFNVKGLDYFDFITNTVATANATTSIYDHLLLSESQIEERIILFNALTIGYTTCSERLNNLYSSFKKYPKPSANVEDGVDLDFFKPRNLERLADENKEVIVGWVGNSKWGGDGIDHKGLETIIKPAVESLRAEGYNVRGFYADRMERWIPHNEMSDYYNSIDIVVCASDIEGTPNPALEGMACGIPVVSTDVGIVPQLFGPLQQDYILPSRTLEDLKSKLKDLISSPEKRVAISKENLEEIKKWTWENQCKKFDNFFQTMLFISRQPHIKERRDCMRKQMLEMYVNANLIKTTESAAPPVVPEPAETIDLSVQYDELKEFANQLQIKINLMEQSAFWKMRTEWFKLKKKVGLAKNKY
jgi:glycosyltransferase involved in cell wall biosynthesis